MHYLFQGLGLLTTKGLRRFVLIPLTINLLLFSLAFFYLLQYVEGWVDMIMTFVPDFLAFLSYVIWPLLILTTVLGLAFSFTMVANFIAAPFNALLSEKLEQHLTGTILPDQGISSFIKDIPRMLQREWTKFAYCVPRAILFLVLFFILPVLGQVLWFLFTSWMMAIQYCDYPFDNHKVPFSKMRQSLRAEWSSSFSFGISVSLASMVPFLNLLVMPAAVCGSTVLWLERHKIKTLPQSV